MTRVGRRRSRVDRRPGRRAETADVPAHGNPGHRPVATRAPSGRSQLMSRAADEARREFRAQIDAKGHAVDNARAAVAGLEVAFASGVLRRTPELHQMLPTSASRSTRRRARSSAARAPRRPASSSAPSRASSTTRERVVQPPQPSRGAQVEFRDVTKVFSEGPARPGQHGAVNDLSLTVPAGRSA